MNLRFSFTFASLMVLFHTTAALANSEYLRKLSDGSTLDAYLAAHRSRVQARLAEELVSPGEVTREDLLRHLLLRRFSPAFFDWLDVNGRGATYFHGASSPSLLAFVFEGSRGLLPNQILIRDLGVIPLSGWFDGLAEDPWILNNVGMNVVGAGAFDETFQYAFQHTAHVGPHRWSERRAVLEEDAGSDHSRFLAGLYRKRSEAIHDVPPALAWIMSTGFPVIYGFQPRSDALVWLPFKKGPHTIVASNLSPEELRIIFVPRRYLSRVQKLMNRLPTKTRIEAIALESIKPLANRSFEISRSVCGHLFEDYAHPDWRTMPDEEFRRIVERIKK